MPTLTNYAIVAYCDRCHRPFADFATPVTPGYGTHTNAEGDTEYLCFACCADEDRKEMRESGRIMLYLSEGAREVTNWPGTLRFTVIERRTSYHNMAGKNGRTDVWFRDETGSRWHGVNIGNSDICRCRKVSR